MTVVFDGVDVLVEVAWGVNPLTDPGSWTDVSAYVMSVDTRLGKSSERDTFDAGTAQIVMNNGTGRFDPNNASGPYFGNIVPWTHVRVRATYSATTYPIWRGYIVGYTQNYLATSEAALTTFECVDLLGYLSHVTVTSTPYTETQTLTFDSPSPVGALPGGHSATWMQLASTGGTVAGMTLYGRAPGSFVDGNLRPGLIAGSSGSYSFENGEWLGYGSANVTGSFVFWLQVTRHPTAQPLDASGANVQRRSEVVFSHNSDVELAIGQRGSAQLVNQSTGALVADFGVWDVDSTHMVAIVNTGATAYIYVDGYKAYTSGFAIDISSVSIGHDPATVVGSLPAVFTVGILVDAITSTSTQYSDAQILEFWNETVGGYPNSRTADLVNLVLDSLGVPAGLRNVDSASLSSFQKDSFFPSGETASAVLRELESLEQARMYVDREGRLCFRPHYSTWYDTRTAGVTATFGDASGEVGYSGYEPVLDDTTIVNTVTFPTPAGDRTVTDSTSVTRYGTYSADVDLTELTDPNVSQAFAELLISRKKNPYTRAGTVTIYPRNTPSAKFPTVLGMDIGKKYTLKRRPPNAGTQTTDHLLDGIEHNITIDSWTTRAYLSRADSSNGFIVGDATYGVVGTSSVTY